MSNRINFTLAYALVLAMTLAGCSTVALKPGTGPLSSRPGTIGKVVVASQVACGFIPTAATVSNILGAGVPGLGTVAAIAGAICAAVAPLSSGPGLEGVKQGFVGGIKVQGAFAP